MSKKKLLLIDGYSIAFRAFYAMHSQLHRMKNKNGLHTNALYGFHNMLEAVMEKEQPTHALVAFDAGKTTFRHELFDDYKGGRESMPAELSEQIPYLKELIAAYGLQTYQLPDYEADDIIGTLSTQASDEFEVVIITGDKDLTQLASDQTRVDITKKGITQLKSYTPESMMEEMGITPGQITDLKGLSGDSSDNIPGVTQIGDKTALKLLKKFHTVEELYERIDEMNASKRKEYLIAEKETALLSKQLATIITDAPIEISPESLAYSGKNMEALIGFYKEMDFNSHLEKLDTDVYFEELQDEAEAVEYEWVEEVTEEMFGQSGTLYFEMFEENYHTAPYIIASWTNEKKVYIAEPETLLASKVFQDWLEDESARKYTYDAKALMVSLKQRELEIANITFDLSLASYVLTAENSSGGDVAAIANKHGYVDVLEDEAVYGKGKKVSIPDDKTVMYEHVARKVTAIDTLAEQLTVELANNDQLALFEEIELPLAHVLGEMEIQGITTDANRLEAMKEEFADVLEEIEAKIYAEAGESFNINSPKQLSDVLFSEDKLNYEPIRKTKTGYSTAQDVLEKMTSYAPIAKLILEYRTIAKLQSTYVEGLLDVIEADGKIHTRYGQTVARTGRLSSVDPNLQNIPVRSEMGRKIRQAFVPREDGWKIFGADYSQIELRILAHMSEDEALIETYLNDQDVHTTTAMKVFDLESPAEVTANQRRDAKAVNFGIVYGISDYGLSENLGITRKEAREYIDTYFSRFPKVKEYIDQSIREAKDKGYVETLYHRRRYLPDINSRNFNVRSFAERTAMNTPIQGSAADIIKVAMVEMQKRLKASDLKATMLLQVHDELIFEAPESELAELEALVSDVMEHVVELDVPLQVASSSGDNWYEAK